MLENEDCIDAFVALPSILDTDLFINWIHGVSEVEVAHKLPNVAQFYLNMGALTAEVRSNYTQFMLLESELFAPDLFVCAIFGSQFQLERSVKIKFIQIYYEVDSVVIRELLGRKLNNKDRRDLDDISENTGVPLFSCKRQFQNLRRVIKYCEDLVGNVKLLDAISQKFLLKNDLAQKYVAAVFLSHHRFETNKKKMCHITFKNFQKCVDDIMVNWTNINKDLCLDSESFHPADIDTQFLQDLKGELKVLADKKEIIDDLKHLIFPKLKSVIPEKSYGDLESLFKTLYKSIHTIGSNLSHSKAIRDFFIDIIERIVEPCRNCAILVKEMDNFQEAFCQSLLEYNLVKRTQTVRFLQTLFNCVIIFYTRFIVEDT